MPRFVPPAQTYDGYIFDCDGTLVDSMPLHFRGWRHALAVHGAPFDFDWALFVSRAGMPVDVTVAALNQQFGCDLPAREVAATQHAWFEEHIADLQPIPEVAAFARALHGAAPLSVASGGLRPTVLRSLEVTGMRDLFPTVVTASDVPRGKPHPDMLLACAEAMGVAPHRCLVIEDGAAGIDAARAAGMPWVRVEAPGPQEIAPVAIGPGGSV